MLYDAAMLHRPGYGVLLSTLLAFVCFGLGLTALEAGAIGFTACLRRLHRDSVTAPLLAQCWGSCQGQRNEDKHEV